MNCNRESEQMSMLIVTNVVRHSGQGIFVQLFCMEEEYRVIGHKVTIVQGLSFAIASCLAILAHHPLSI